MEILICLSGLVVVLGLAIMIFHIVLSPHKEEDRKHGNVRGQIITRGK